MKKGNNPLLLIDSEPVRALFLGSAQVPEHIHGIDELIELIKEPTADLFHFEQEGNHACLIAGISVIDSEDLTKILRNESSELALATAENIVTAWDEVSFGIHVRGDELCRFLQEVYSLILKKEVSIKLTTARREQLKKRDLELMLWV